VSVGDGFLFELGRGLARVGIGLAFIATFFGCAYAYCSASEWWASRKRAR
jgi:hypothetical protein